MCTNILFLRVLNYLSIFLQILRYTIPLGLIVKISFDAYQGVLGNGLEVKDIFQRSSKRIIAAIIVFILPSIVNFFVSSIENIFSQSLDYQSCLENIKYIDYYEELERIAYEKEQQEKNAYLKQKYEQIKQEQNELIKKNQANAKTGSGGSYVGQKYNLTEHQLKNIAKVCQKEQNSANGAAAEASLMANRYEIQILKKSKKWSKRSFYDYVMNCNWWAPAKKGTYSSVKLKPEILSAVRSVLIDGQRTLPFYVDEHDWTGDISKIVTNGKTLRGRNRFKDTKNFVQDVTVIHNKMGAVYTYHSHPNNSKDPDPFGYTSGSKKLIDGLSN